MYIVSLWRPFSGMCHIDNFPLPSMLLDVIFQLSQHALQSMASA